MVRSGKQAILAGQAHCARIYLEGWGAEEDT